MPQTMTREEQQQKIANEKKQRQTEEIQKFEMPKIKQYQTVIWYPRLRIGQRP